ncbi:MAG: peptidoglycan DD-metalloendopeptidase family protein [Cyanobacteria bacterium]|nr:peptidoglycan DD-metalloendopeptidase family protein [Cyanobacteriota bacterium]MDW8200628.1 peptidoglycan DD-metalloendopeptidase family protein [Cyanobacteriota bacterium SKYGB_h_bin112]
MNIHSTVGVVSTPKALWLMLWRGLKVWLGSWIMVVGMLLGTWPALAVPQGIASSLMGGASISPPVLLQAGISGAIEDLVRQQQQLENQRQNLAKERDRLQNLETEASRTLNTLQTTVQDKTRQIQAQEAQKAKAEEQLRVLQKELAIATDRYQRHQLATVARLQFLQRQQRTWGWATLLQSQNLNEFLDRRYQLRLLYEHDRQMLAQLTREAKAIEEKKLRVEAQKNQIILLTQQLMAQRAQASQQAAYQKSVISRLQNDRLALEAAEDRLAADSNNLAALIQQKIAEQRARESYGAVIIRGTGQLSFPSDGALTSYFGWRVHPILGYERFHSGIDFAADYGSPIRAADNGYVIFAGWYGGYGNAVILDHGNGISTLYGHAEELLVAEGQYVQRGQVIATVGSTGLSTGPHLHFEVRQGGEPVDPMAFL